MTLALEVDELDVSYGGVPAVRGVDLRIEPGEAYGLIGETGSGKTTVANAVARLLPPNSVVSGRIRIDSVDVATMRVEEFRKVRGTKIGYVPQDAIASLNPVMPVGRQVAELFEVHYGTSRSESQRRAIEELRRMWIADPGAVARLYPHQLSGGMRQRVMIAIALALRPPLLIADEPTTALDVSTQAEILRLVGHLRTELGVAVLWITHDMGVVAELADRVGVMYAGRVVEEGTASDLFDHARHPYTVGLLRTLQSLRSGEAGSFLYQIEGQPPASLTAISGCPFHPRCRWSAPDCVEVLPPLIRSDDRRLACHHPVEQIEAGATH